MTNTPHPPQPHPSPALYDIAGVCRLLSISRSSLYELMRRGDLPARKVGRRTLISLASLQALLAGLPAAQFRPPVPPASNSARRRG